MKINNINKRDTDTKIATQSLPTNRHIWVEFQKWGTQLDHWGNILGDTIGPFGGYNVEFQFCHLIVQLCPPKVIYTEVNITRQESCVPQNSECVPPPPPPPYVSPKVRNFRTLNPKP